MLMLVDGVNAMLKIAVELLTKPSKRTHATRLLNQEADQDEEDQEMPHSLSEEDQDEEDQEIPQ